MSKNLSSMQGVFWSKNIKNLNLQTDKNYIIHQVLMYGSLKQIDWLKKTYSSQEIQQIFVNHPTRIYTPQAFNFVKNYLLKIKQSLDKNLYVKTIS